MFAYGVYVKIVRGSSYVNLGVYDMFYLGKIKYFLNRTQWITLDWFHEVVGEILIGTSFINSSNNYCFKLVPYNNYYGFI